MTGRGSDNDGPRKRSAPGPRPRGRGGRRTLSPEERQLWRRVSETVTPLQGKDAADEPAQEESRQSPPPDAAKTAPAGVAASSSPSSAPGRRSPIEGPASGRAVREQGPPDPPVLSDRRTRRGQHDIDARLDLHGETQIRARAMLTRFLQEARVRRHRCVLVITGKGIKLEPSDPQRPFDMFERREPGVLRQLLPVWLGEGDLRSLIRGYAPAHQRHGGGGAWYVFPK